MSGSISFQLQIRPTPPVVAQTWSSTHIDTQIVLSNGNLTASMSGAQKNALAFGKNAFAASSGKYYYEVTVNYTSTCRVGIGNTNSAVNGTGALGQAIDAIGWQPNGAVFSNGAQVATWAPYSTGQTLRIAYDLVNLVVWGCVGTGYWNNSPPANPAMGLTGGGLLVSAGVYAYPVTPGVMLNQATLPDHYVAAFSAAAWNYTAPVGFGSTDQVTAAPWQNVGAPLIAPPYVATATGLTTLTQYDTQVVASNLWGQTPSSIRTVTTTA